MMRWGGDMPGWGGHWLGGIVMLLFWVLVLAGIIALARGVFSRSSGRSSPGPESPLDILKRRYAEREIDQAEFEEKRKGILES